MHRDAAFETSGKAYTVFEAEGAAGEIANPGHKRYSRVLRMTSPVDRAFMSPVMRSCSVRRWSRVFRASRAG